MRRIGGTPGAALLGAAALGAFLTMGGATSPEAPATPFADGPPLGQTGGFGESTCHSCHDELPLNGDQTARLTVEGLPEPYTPGGTYLITVALTSEGMARAGFEASFRFEGTPPPGRQAGTLRALDSRVKVSYLGLTPVYYVHHTRLGSELPAEGTTSWSFQWIAPESEHPVLVHLASNSANGDNSPLGDYILTYEQVLRAR